MKHRLHVLGFPHTWTAKEHCACAYTAKVYKFCRMMYDLGHTVYHYGAEGSDPIATENVQVMSRKEQEKYFGVWSKDNIYDAKLDWDPKMEYWRLINTRSIAEVLLRKQKKDIICAITASQKLVCDAFADECLGVEYGIGYTGTFSKYRCFESYSHMHMMWGHDNLNRDGSYYDVVIPNYFDMDDFPDRLSEQRGDYYFFIGRLISRKGIKIAVDVCNQLGKRLVIAGQGCKEYKILSDNHARLVGWDNQVYEGNIQYIGHVNIEQRNVAMAGAIATFVPTIYIEPFGGVNVEAQLTGCPAITTDWGAFSETVEHGKTGYRCRTLDQFIWAAQNVSKLDRFYIRERAIKLWSLPVIGRMYEEYFDMLTDLWSEKGWGTLHPERIQLDWLSRSL